MVSPFLMQSYYRTAPLSVDTNHTQKPFDDEDNGILDDGILDSNAMDSGLELSPPMADSRRESFAMGPSLFATKTEDWHSIDMQSVPSNTPFGEQTSNNPFLRFDQHQSGVVLGSQNLWTMNHPTASGSDTPINQFDSLPTEYDATATATPAFQRPMHGPTPFTTQGNIFASLGSSEQSLPTSPQKDWMGTSQPVNKKVRPQSPAYRSYNELRRGDGIRKKNARFEIPPERTLNNIDQLISQSTDEQEIKELKQQKRLLRNRQAALDSRQRKKLHTERLEDEKKTYTAIISELEDEVTNLRAKMEQIAIDNSKYIQCIESMRMEKDEMIRSHTVETGELRKKVGVLTEHVHTLSTGLAGQSSMAGPYDPMDDMTMGPSWDAHNFLHDDYPIEIEQEPELKQEMSVVPAKKQDSSLTSADGEKGAGQGGLLFMLFLVGAFVMSNRSTPAIPPVSEDVRVASATLLDNVLKDAGVNSPSNEMQTAPPRPSGVTWADPVPSMPANDMSLGSVAPSMLTELGDSLTQPTQQQTNEQIFSLSAAQYNGVSDSAFLQNNGQHDRSTSQGRRNLAEALSEMRETKKQTGAAEVYTRSLLWDQIPNEVVRNFAKMFAECNSAYNEQQCNEVR